MVQCRASPAAELSWLTSVQYVPTGRALQLPHADAHVLACSCVDRGDWPALRRSSGRVRPPQNLRATFHRPNLSCLTRATACRKPAMRAARIVLSCLSWLLQAGLLGPRLPRTQAGRPEFPWWWWAFGVAAWRAQPGRGFPLLFNGPDARTALCSISRNLAATAERQLSLSRHTAARKTFSGEGPHRIQRRCKAGCPDVKPSWLARTHVWEEIHSTGLCWVARPFPPVLSCDYLSLNGGALALASSSTATTTHVIR